MNRGRSDRPHISAEIVLNSHREITNSSHGALWSAAPGRIPFMRPFESRGVPVDVDEGGSIIIDVKQIEN